MNVPATDTDRLAGALASAAQRIRPFGARVVHLPSTGSTNDVAGQLASAGAPEGTLVIADTQTAGRGRMGHAWFSPPLAGLYASAVLRPRGGVFAEPSSVALITLMAGVAVVDGVRAASGLTAVIKWPNDVIVGSRGDDGPRKLAGILAEGDFTAGVLRHVVLGIGVNLTRAAYPADIADRATSLEDHAARPADRGAVLVEVAAALAREYAALAAHDVSGLIARWRERSPSCEGAAVTWMTSSGPQQGVTAGIDDTGGLRVRTSGGRIEVLRAGQVSWR